MGHVYYLVARFSSAHSARSLSAMPTRLGTEGNFMLHPSAVALAILCIMLPSNFTSAFLGCSVVSMPNASVYITLSLMLSFISFAHSNHDTIIFSCKYWCTVRKSLFFFSSPALLHFQFQLQFFNSLYKTQHSCYICFLVREILVWYVLVGFVSYGVVQEWDHRLRKKYTIECGG